MSACIVSHTHWDRAWYLPFQVFRVRLVALVDRVLDMLEADPRFRAFLLDGQTIVLDDYLEARPDAEPRIRALVTAGRLHTGPWYVLPDEFLVSGEALIRNLLLGTAIAGRFGGAMRIGYLPDSFGHVHTLPQLLNGFGITSFVFMRGMPAGEYERLGREFIWDGPADSAVVAIYLRDGYYNAAGLGFQAVPPHPVAFGDFEGLEADPELGVAQLRAAAEAARRGSRAPVALLMNGMDHMPIQPELPDLLEAQARTAGAPEIRHATLPEYVDAVRQIAESLPHFRGELRGNAHHPILAGVHSARIYLKRQNQRVQALLETHAEPLSAALGLEGAGDAPILALAWRQLLQTHAHDDVCGCSVDAVHEDDAHALRQAEQIALAVSERAATRLATLGALTHAPNEALLLVHNGHARRARCLVHTRVFVPSPDAEHVALYDVDGAEVPIEVRAREDGLVEPRFLENPVGTAFDIAFEADVPAAGYTFYRAAAAPVGTRLEWRRADGEVALGSWRASIANAGIQLRPPGGTDAAPLLIEDEADGGDTYSFSPVGADDAHRVSIQSWATADSAVAAHIRVDIELDTPASSGEAVRVRSPIRLELSAAHDGDELRITVQLDNRAQDHRLRLLIPIGRPAGRSWASVPFGVVERDHTTVPVRGEAGEAPYPTCFSEDFVLTRGDGRSVLVAHRGLHEYEMVERDGRGYMAITLLRAVGMLSRTGGRIRSVQAGPAVAVPGAQCLGPQRAELAVRVVPGQLGLAAAASLAGEFARPPLVINAAPGARATTAPLHAARRRLLRVAPEGVAISALRVREDGRLVLRVQNRNEESVAAAIELLLPFEAVDRCRLDEGDLVPQTADGATIRLELATGELATLCYTLVP